MAEDWAWLQAYQQVMTQAVLASCLVNTGTVLSVSAMGSAATASFIGAALFGLMLLFNLLKVRPLTNLSSRALCCLQPAA